QAGATASFTALSNVIAKVRAVGTHQLKLKLLLVVLVVLRVSRSLGSVFPKPEKDLPEALLEGRYLFLYGFELDKDGLLESEAEGLSKNW
ncbi:hypothetical protein BGZ49_001641, partial [Haplosporangium sp. Z 27]